MFFDCGCVTAIVAGVLGVMKRFRQEMRSVSLLGAGKMLGEGKNCFRLWPTYTNPPPTL